MKKYKLLKDLPGYNAGEIFAELEIKKVYASPDERCSSKFSMDLDKLPEWFEEIKEGGKCTCKEAGYGYCMQDELGACGKPTEKEECKHEHGTYQDSFGNVRCSRCSKEVLISATQPKQFPSVWIKERASRNAESWGKEWNHRSPNDYIVAILDFLDEHFKY